MAAGLRRPAARPALLLALGVAALWEGSGPLDDAVRLNRPRAPALAFISGNDGEASESPSSDWSLGTMLSQIPLFGDYLLESGYLWPILGVVFACLLFVRPPAASGRPSDRRRGLVSSMNCEVPAQGNNAPAYDQQQAAYDFQVPPGYALVPIDQYAVPQSAPQGQLAPIYEEDGSQAGDPQAREDVVTPQDFKALLDRTQQDDSLAEGIACIRQSFLGQRDPEARVGYMDARKVLDIERVLVQELEESFSQKVGFIASLFHRWRCEAMCLRIGRRYEEDFNLQKGEWERYLDSHEKTFEQKVLDAARKAAEQEDRNRQVAALLLDQWAHGDRVALKRMCFGGWKDLTARLHQLKVQKSQVGCVVQLWVEGGRRGLMHMCLKSWCQLTRESIEAAEKAKELEAAKNSWDRFFDDEHAKLQKNAEDTMSDIQRRWQSAERDVGLALAKWERGLKTALGAVVFKTWSQHAWKMQRLRRQKHAVQQAVLELCGGEVAGLAKGCFANWRSLAIHEATLVQERRKWEALLSGEKQQWEEEDRIWEESRRQKKAAAKQMVSLTLQKWERGEVEGLMLKVFLDWRKDAAKLGAAKRRRESVHSSVLRFLEGKESNDVRNCFIHWKVLSERTMVALKQEQELLEKRTRWEELLADEKRRFEDELDTLETSTQAKVKQAKAVVELALAGWELGSDVGLLLEVFFCWHSTARQNKRLAHQRQAVHLTLMKSLAGNQRGSLQSCVLNWKMWTRHVVESKFGEKRMTEERQKWEHFLENEDKAHAESLQRLHAENEEKWTVVEQAVGELLSKWHRSRASSLLHVGFLGWRQLTGASATINCGKQMVHLAVLRFFDGDSQKFAHGFFLNWKHWAKMEVLFKTEVAERRRLISQLEEHSQRLISNKESRLLKYAGVLGACTDPMFMIMVLASWRMHAVGMKSAEAHRQLEVALQEQQRLHNLIVTRRKQLSTATLHLLGLKDEVTLVMDCWLAWSRFKQEAKQEWAHQLAHNEMIKKYAWYIQCLASKETGDVLVAGCFWELVREAKSQRHAREREEMSQKIAELNVELQVLEAERIDINDSLATTYQQIDSVTETLQKELKLKEEIAAELREAYDKLRQQSARRAAMPIRAITLASSTSEKSELPHLPASVLGMPGGQSVDLQRSLVGGSARQRSEESMGGGARTPSSVASGTTVVDLQDRANWTNTAERIFHSGSGR